MTMAPEQDTLTICFHNQRNGSSLPALSRAIRVMALAFLVWIFTSPAYAALNIPITVTLSEAAAVTGTPRIAVDVGGATRYATYTSGTGTNTLTFTYSVLSGDVDMDGITVFSPIQLNGGTLSDLKGNPATLTFTPPDTTNVKVNAAGTTLSFRLMGATVYDLLLPPHPHEGAGPILRPQSIPATMSSCT